MQGNDFELEALGYPSEMHLWEGLLFVEKKRKIFFSSDLMFSMGENHGQVDERTWEDALKSSGVDLILNHELQNKLAGDLKNLRVDFVASGHGPCIKIRR